MMGYLPQKVSYVRKNSPEDLGHFLGEVGFYNRCVRIKETGAS